MDSVRWLIPNQIVLADKNQNLSALDQVMLPFFHEAETPFYLILNGDIVKSRPGFFITKERDWLRHAKLKGIICYNLNHRRLSVVTKLICQFWGIDFVLVDNYRQALDKLKELDKSLNLPDSPLDDESIHDTQRLDRKSVQQYLANQAPKNHCDYCRLPVGILPMKRLDGSILVCETCNNAMQGANATILFNPRYDKWDDHFEWDDDEIELFSLTERGMTTIHTLGLNSRYRVNLREQLAFSGSMPAPDPRQNGKFPKDGKVRLEIQNAYANADSNKIVIDPRGGINFGRKDPAHFIKIDVDLLPYGGYRMGVSRYHARIHPPDYETGQLRISDSGSSYGTFLNGQRIRPVDGEVPLKHGDKLQLGELVLTVYFQQ